MYFLSSEYQWLPQQELRLTVDEAVRALTACGTECGVIYRTTEPMRASEVVRLFDLLEIVAETTVDDLHSLFISVSDSAMDLSVEWRRRSVGDRLPGGDGAAGGRLVADPHRDKGAGGCIS